MAEKFVIKGGKPLRGEVEIRGAKNAAFPILAASLLTKEDCVVSNLPLIEDVFQMLKILEELGVKIFWIGRRTVKLNSFGVDLAKIPFATIKKFRGSILILGPLISRFGELKIPPPGGCLIGARPIDTHLDAFSQLGVDVSSKNGFSKVTEAGAPSPPPSLKLRRTRRLRRAQKSFCENSASQQQKIRFYFQPFAPKKRF